MPCVWRAPRSRGDTILAKSVCHDVGMARPTRFEHSQYLGDKRTQVVYDLDDPLTPASVIAEIVDLGVGASFGPDTLAEARNRNYRAYTGRKRRLRSPR